MDRRLNEGAGFSLLEVLCVLAIGGLVVASLLSLFRVQAALARDQALAADLQQAARIARHEVARHCRMAGRGGLPRSVAVAVRSNTEMGARLAGAGSPALLPGSDVLVVRGVFEGSLFEVAAAVTDDALGSLTLLAGAQPDPGALEDLLEVAAEEQGRALVLSGGADRRHCSIAELTGNVGVERSPAGEIEELRLGYRTAGSAVADRYRELAESCRPGPSGWVRTVGLLEEVRFYVRRGGASNGRPPNHRLSRGRFLPGLDRPIGGRSAASVPLVDHVLDFQVALGGDLDGDGEIGAEAPAGSGAEEWLFDDPDEAAATIPVEAVRFSLLLRAARPTRGYRAPPVERLEDRLYGSEVSPGGLAARRYRQRLASMVAGVRGG